MRVVELQHQCQLLTVTGNSSSRCGIRAKDYAEGGDASALAATGYTVTRSAMANNGDGTYTWTYTVMPNP